MKQHLNNRLLGFTDSKAYRYASKWSSCLHAWQLAKLTMCHSTAVMAVVEALAQGYLTLYFAAQYLLLSNVITGITCYYEMPC